MKLNLVREEFTEKGVFGILTNDEGTVCFFTLEHAYADVIDGGFLSKIADGTYTCVRGKHQLHSMKAPFETFEITKVPGHSNILFHVGNYNDDSDGCVLLGNARSEVQLLNSASAFKLFMTMLDGLDSFDLDVSSL